MTKGYLINSKQIIAYAKWYLNNPLRSYAPFYHKKTSWSPEGKIDPNHLDDARSANYATLDIQKARLLLQQARKHPDMLAFAPSMYTSLWQSMDGMDGFGFNSGYRMVGHDFGWDDFAIDVPTYVKKLKQQTVFSFKEVANVADKINAINKRRNARRIAWNKHCDTLITKLAKKSSKRVQYKKFLGSDFRLEDEDIEHEAPADMAYDLIYLYPKHDDYRDILALSDKNSTISRHFNEFSIDKNGQVYFKGKATNVYGNIAYWSARKVNLVPLINVSSLPKESVFKKDINVHILLNTNFNSVNHKHVSNQHEIADYERFIADRQKATA